MRHSLVSLILVLLRLSTSLAQVTTTTGNPHPFIESQKELYFAEGKEILAIKIFERKIYLQKFNSENLSADTVTIYNDLRRGLVIEKIVKLKGRYFLFYSSWDGEYHDVFRREINFKNGTFVNGGESILKVKAKIAGSHIQEGYFQGNRFGFSFSADSTRILIYSRKSPEIKDDTRSFEVTFINVYDQDLKLIWNKEVEMPYTEKVMDAIGFAIDGKGNVHSVAKVSNYVAASLTGMSSKNYRIEILTVAAEQTIISKTLVASPAKFVKSTWLYDHPDGYMVGTGFYNQGDTNNDNADGFIVFKLSPDGKILESDVKTYDMPLEITNLYVERKEYKKAKFEDLDLNSFYIQRDGSLLIISEQKEFSQGSNYSYYTGSPYGSGMASSSTPPKYFYNDIVVTKIDSEGKLVWMRRLPNRQESKESTASSFQYAKIGDKHNFLVVENFRNKDLPLIKKPAGHYIGNPGLLTTYSIEDDKGNLSKTMLLDTRDAKGLEIFKLTPRRIVRTAENEFVGEAFKRDNEDILVKIKLE